MTNPPKSDAGRLRWKIATAILALVSLTLLATVLNYKSQVDDMTQQGKELQTQLGDCESRADKALAQGETLKTDISNCKSQLSTTEQREKTFMAEAANVKAQVVGLQTSVADLKATALTRSLNPRLIDEFKSKGLKDPLNDIVADLEQHNELIPYEGWHGSKMCFCFPSEIQVLNSKWVHAYFEDGYNCGYMLLAYQVEEGGKISWRVLDSTLEC